MKEYKISCVDSPDTDYIEVKVNLEQEKVVINTEENKYVNSIYLDIYKTKELILMLQEALKKIKE